MQIRIRITHRVRTPRESSMALNGGEPLHSPASAKRAAGVSAASLVAIGIFGSRITGLVRERVIGYFFGLETVVADALRASIRIPNLLSNLFGEGVLSASFVTVYAKLRAAGEDEESEHLAEAVFGILAIVCGVLVLLGIALSPYLIDLIAPGFKGEKRDLAIHIVRILFPGTGLLVMSAWCLGVLNSHRHFLLSYLAPVAMNVTVIFGLISVGHEPQNRLVLFAAWMFVGGYALQFLVQVPRVLQLLPAFRPAFDFTSPHVRAVIRNFGPIFLSRGVVQISAYIDQMIASWLPTGAVAALNSGQVIAILPISLFSMSVSAAELPSLSSAVGTTEEVAAILRRRLAAGLRRIAFFIVPSAVAFLLLGDVLAALLYQTGRVSHTDAIYLWSVLAGSSVGLLASSLGRLYSSAYYAMLDTRTPLRFAMIRVVITTALGVVCAFFVPRWLGIDAKWGVAGLTASAGVAGWVEFALLRRGLTGRIGSTHFPGGFVPKLWIVAFLSGFLALGVKLLLNAPRHPIAVAIAVLPLYGIGYFGGTALLRIEESEQIISTVRRRLRR